MTSPDGAHGAGFEVLRRFAKRRTPVERCDLCGVEVAPIHDHLIDPAERRLACACGACAVLFSAQAGTRYKRVPHDVIALDELTISASQWEALRLPIDLAFFYDSTPQGRVVACYPSPAGATESLLELESWEEIRGEHPVLHDLQPDVQALLVNRVRARRGPQRLLHRADRPVLPAGRHHSDCTGRDSPGAAPSGRRSTASSGISDAWPAPRGRASVPDLRVQVEGAEVTPFAMVPLLTFRLRVTNASPDETIHNVVLRCQIQIEATKRHYGAGEEARLRDLFGEPERWGQTLRAMLWTHANVVVPPFTGEVTAELPVPCTYDFNIAATKYFYALEEGDIPLDFLFSGSVFYQDGDGALQVAPISWSLEARFRLPVKTWRLLMDTYYPNIAFVELRRDVFDRLYQYKVRHGIPTWEQAVERILPPVDEEAPV